MEKKVIIVGAGLVGSLWAIYMSKAGYKVTIYERRSDIRKAEISAGKSINLALSYRGWKALRGAGVDDEVKKIALPMYNRIMHDSEGNLTTQPYGKKDQAIYSVSRGLLNSIMMTMAEEKGNAGGQKAAVALLVYIHLQNRPQNAVVLWSIAFADSFRRSRSSSSRCLGEVRTDRPEAAPEAIRPAAPLDGQRVAAQAPRELAADAGSLRRPRQATRAKWAASHSWP